MKKKTPIRYPDRGFHDPADSVFFLYFTWIGVQVGSTQPFQVFLVSFAFLMILSSSQCFVTYLCSFIKGKHIGSTQIPPTLYALNFDSFIFFFPVNGSCCIWCPSLIYSQSALITDVVRLLFSTVACLNHHVQDTLLWVEFNSFRFCCCHFLHPSFLLSLRLSMLIYDSIFFNDISD